MSSTEDDLRDFTAFVKERISRGVGQEKGRSVPLSHRSAASRT